MSCKAGATCKTHKSVTPKHGEIEKTGPRQLREGFYYPECSLLQIGDDGVYEPLSAPDPALIKAAMICEVDARDWVEDCSIGMVLRGCLIADFTFMMSTPMPTVPTVVEIDGEMCTVYKPLPTPAQFTFSEEEIEAIRSCSNCCLTFEWLANVCLTDPGTEEAPKKAVAPKPVEAVA